MPMGPPAEDTFRRLWFVYDFANLLIFDISPLCDFNFCYVEKQSGV